MGGQNLPWSQIGRYFTGGVQRRNQYPRDKAVKTRPVEPMGVGFLLFHYRDFKEDVLPARPVFISVELIRNLKHKGIISSTEKQLIKPPRAARPNGRMAGW